MDTSKKTTAVRIIIFVVIVAAIVAAMTMIAGGGKKSADYTAFAQCLQQKGIKFYGAFWCPHCQAQERSFGMSRQDLEKVGLYQECSLPSGNGQTQICIDNNIESYPTWVFPDGTRASGEQELSLLAEKSGCALPSAATQSANVSAGSASSAN